MSSVCNFLRIPAYRDRGFRRKMTAHSDLFVTDFPTFPESAVTIAEFTVISPESSLTH
uniref:Uncharacterized protein n=2 Tax=Candidatus Kentrum sp. LPFa TaxID=2126335 RepID=A0A450Y3R4_9GAMM|nr:MAG: hypothetical protein BECKLPF1236C_GA0070990_105062 [Candidatus Kentron sp. LPFa]